jgi:hypothetical protein
MNPKFRNLDFDPHKLPKDYLEAIGLASACYAQTEDNVQWAIAGLLGIDMERRDVPVVRFLARSSSAHIAQWYFHPMDVMIEQLNIK